MYPHHLNHLQRKLWFLMSHNQIDLDTFSLAMRVTDIVWPYSLELSREGKCIFNYINGNQEWCCRMKLMSPGSDLLRLFISTQPFKSEVVRRKQYSYVLTSSAISSPVLNKGDYVIFREVIKAHTDMDPYIFSS